MKLLQPIIDKLAALERQSLRRRLRTVETPCSPHLRIDGRELLAFSSNDYLGLATHPVLIDAMAEGARQFGVGSGAAHLVSGHSSAHAQLEATLAEFLSPWIPQAKALFFCTGYMANLGVIPALAEAGANKREGRAIFADALNHASLIDGVRLARDVSTVEYPHADAEALATALSASPAGHKLIVTDGVFSMDGDIAPLRELTKLAEQHDAWLVVDDAHGFGVLGEHGAGILEHAELRSPNIVYMGTLGKAAGVAGAFVVAHETVIDWLLQRARTYVFTTAAPPAVAHTVSQSLTLIAGDEGKARREKLKTLCRYFQAQLQLKHWRLLPSPTAIQPVLIGSNSAALATAQALNVAGIWVPAIRPPTVPTGTARLRVALSAAHTEADIDRLCSALAAAEENAS